jgi:hypothetical protein
MTMRARWGLAVILALTGRAAAAAPGFSFGPTALTVHGITPGGHAVLFSVAWENGDGPQLVRRESVLPDSDEDGQVHKDLGKDIPEKSVWFAVDLENGERTVVLPAGSPLREVPFLPQVIANSRDRLEMQRTFIQLVLVRPRVGAWGGRVRDGRKSDPDARPDGAVEVLLSSLWALGDSPSAPRTLEAGDILLIVDPDRDEFMAYQLGR